MRKKSFLCFILSVLFILISGCETTKGVAQGMGYTAEGIAKDAKSFWQAMLKADNWMKDNLW